MEIMKNRIPPKKLKVLTMENVHSQSIKKSMQQVVLNSPSSAQKCSSMSSDTGEESWIRKNLPTTAVPSRGKRTEFLDKTDDEIRNKLVKVYHVLTSSLWEDNKEAGALNSYSTYRERIRLATMIFYDILSRKKTYISRNR